MEYALKLVVLSSLFFFTNVLFANTIYNPQTISASVKAVLLYEKLSHLSKSCKNDAFLKLASIAQLEKNLKLKTHVTVRRFSEILEQDSNQYKATLRAIKKMTCSKEVIEGKLEQTYNDYDLALFNLTLVPTLKVALQSQKDLRKNTSKSSVQAFLNSIEKADTIAVGQLILNTHVLPQYRKHFVGYDEKSKYVYHLSRGWKNLAPKYVLAEQTSHEQGNLDSQSQRSLGTQYIFSIKNNTILQKVKLDHSSSIIDQLGEEDWYWIGGMLNRNNNN